MNKNIRYIEISNNKAFSHNSDTNIISLIKKLFLFIILISGVLLISCETEPPKPDTPIFSDVETLEIYESGGTYYFENLPSYVKNIQVLIFASANQPVIDDNSKLITNIDDLKGGNRTGLNNISRTEVSGFYGYDTGTKDFNSTDITGTVIGTDWFIVLGFDEYFNLTHASPKYNESDL